MNLRCRTQYYPTIAQGLLILAIAGLIISFLLAHLTAQPLPPTQDGVNYYFQARITDHDRRINDLEAMWRYGMGALLVNLVAHLFQIRTLQKSKDDKS